MRKLCSKVSMLIFGFALMYGVPVLSQANEDGISVHNDTDGQVRVSWISFSKEGLMYCDPIILPVDQELKHSFAFQRGKSLMVFVGGYPNGQVYNYDLTEADGNRRAFEVSELTHERFRFDN